MNFYGFLVVLMIIASVIMGLLVLVQNSKGGGLVAGMQSSNQFLGVRQTADFLEKSTWTLALIILGLSLISVMTIPQGGTQTEKSRLQDYVKENNLTPVSVPENSNAQPIQQ